MSFNPLLLNDTFCPIIDFINQYDCNKDRLVTKVCLKLTCKLFFEQIVIDNWCFKKSFFEILAKSTINSQKIFEWFYSKKSYGNVWTSFYSCIKGDLISLICCYQNGCPWDVKTYRLAAKMDI